MSSTPVFSNYETENNNKAFHYSRAVRVGPWIKCAGQGGWDKEGVIPDDHDKQVLLAFENVEKAIKSAKGNGWQDVITIRTYHLDISKFSIFVDQFKKYMPNHMPTWTCVEVTKLGDPDMLIEIEVEAYVTE